MSSIREGMIYIIVGFLGNVGVFTYALITRPVIFDNAKKDVMTNSLFGAVSYGELATCLYLVGLLGLVFVLGGVLMIVGKKKGWLI
jgi:hypothetical protein